MRWLVDWLFTYNTRKEHDIHTKQVKKNYWRIRISILYFFYSNSSLKQCHCQKSNNFLFLFPSISAMSLPQTNCKNFFFLPSYFCNAITTNSFPQIFSPLFWPTNQLQQFFSLLFRQCHCHKFIPTIFFSFYFGNAIVTNPLPQIFPPLFQQCITTNQLPLFFFFWEMICAHYFLQQILNGRLLLVVIVGLKK